MFNFDLFSFSLFPESKMISVGLVEVDDWTGCLLFVEHTHGTWKFDVLYTRELIRRIRNK